MANGAKLNKATFFPHAELTQELTEAQALQERNGKTANTANRAFHGQM